MKNILCIDTTTKTAACALKIGENIYEDSITNEITHSEKLLPLIDKLLKKENLTLNEIDMLGCINGPGSFTGIRIGLATLKAFAQVKNMPIFSIQSTKAIAAITYINNNVNDEKYIATFIDARNDRVYFALYKVYFKENKISIDTMIDIQNELIDDALNILNDFFKNNNIQNYIFAGNVSKFTDKMKIMAPTLFELYPTPKDAISIFEILQNQNEYIFNAFNLDAVYARMTQAERIKNDGHNN